ncbi:MAG: ShET2/EspL2 family type III secretion system effector toxin [Endozoicomonadaceae bacterium]|nr:ShET2/EspL2 family type III secretion system effector toxin [Endozoicomonadaceae bacterium]
MDNNIKMHAYHCYLKENLSLHGSHTNTSPDEDISLLCVFSYRLVSKSKHKESYITQKIKQLSSEQRQYTGRKFSGSDDHSNVYFLSYFSKGEKIDYNCKVTRNNEVIVCGCFSHWWVNTKKPDFNDINSPEKIINNRELYDSVMLNEHVNFKGCRSVAFYFDVQQFPEILHKIAITLKEGGEQRYTLHSNRHSTGLAIKKRHGSIIILYYDPNDTLRNKRIIVGSETNLKYLKYDDFWSPIALRSYFPDYYKTACLLSIDTKTNQSDCRIECLATPSETLIYLLNRYGHYGHEKAPLCLSCLNDQRKKQLLLEEDICVGPIPIISVAMRNGHHESVKTYIEAVLSSGQNLDEKIKRLTGKYENGISALGIAMKNKHHKAIKVYVESISSSNLPLDKKESLILGETKDGPALFMIFRDGDYEAVKIYIETILETNLPTNTKEKLLTGKRENGVPALFMGLINGHNKIVKFYVEAIATSNLPLDTIERLLTGKLTDGTPVLCIAAQYGHYKAIKVYVESISSSNLPLDKKESLILGETKNGPALFMIFRDGDYEAVKIYIETILETNLPPNTKEKFLTGKRENGVPALFMGLINGRNKIVKFYVEAIATSNLPLDTIERLLTGKLTDGTPALFAALTMEDAATKVYIETVSSSGLDTRIREKLLPR